MTPAGAVPTGTVGTIVLLEASITETGRRGSCQTFTRVPAGFTAMPSAPWSLEWSQ